MIQERNNREIEILTLFLLKCSGLHFVDALKIAYQWTRHRCDLNRKYSLAVDVHWFLIQIYARRNAKIHRVN